jgi:hypothetical protein
MKQHLLLLFLFLSGIAFSQKQISGIIQDENNKPVANASIFLNNTSIGTKADERGHFTLNIPVGKYELIVSSVGYATSSQTIISSELPDFITIKLQVKADVMKEVIIEPDESWEKWGKFFIENFIGTSENAGDCAIKNKEVIHFHNNRKTNQLSATADEPLIIENKALGYIIHYQMETFTFNFKSSFLVYTGYPFFEPMEGNESRQKKWEKRRQDAYKGSMMHFMRAVFTNTLKQEGFEVKALVKLTNEEKKRVKEVYATNLRTERSGNNITVTTINKDSANYYDRIRRQEDYFDLIGKNILTGDSIAYAINNTTAGLDFANYLQVYYKRKQAPLEYRQRYPKSGNEMMSQIVLTNGEPIEIEANGSYYNPVDLMSLGYWSWSEKIAMLLPFDYVPPKE